MLGYCVVKSLKKENSCNTIFLTDIKMLINGIVATGVVVFFMINQHWLDTYKLCQLHVIALNVVSNYYYSYFTQETLI